MSYEHEPEPWSIADSIGELRMFPPAVVWTAAALIAAVAAFGLYQGIRGGLSGSGVGPEEPATGDAVSAQAAQPLSNASQWSALSGPAMASSAAPQANSSQAAAANEDETDSSADESAAPVVTAAPPPPQPVVSAAPAPQVQPQPPAPTAQPSQQSQPVPGTF